jgi:hypothetical protein
MLAVSESRWIRAIKISIGFEEKVNVWFFSVRFCLKGL